MPRHVSLPLVPLMVELPLPFVVIPVAAFASHDAPEDPEMRL